MFETISFCIDLGTHFEQGKIFWQEVYLLNESVAFAFRALNSTVNVQLLTTKLAK